METRFQDSSSNMLPMPCRNRQPQVVREVDNKYNSVRFVFFRIGSHAITADQMPNVTMIADYMKSHPQSKVVIKTELYLLSTSRTTWGWRLRQLSSSVARASARCCHAAALASEAASCERRLLMSPLRASTWAWS